MANKTTIVTTWTTLHFAILLKTLSPLAPVLCAGAFWLPVLVSLITIGLVTFLVVAQMTPPAVVSASAPSTAFSAKRAYEHLKTIASVPHPTGSSENTQVREYLFKQLALLGLQPEIQTSTSVYNDTGK